MLLPRLLRFSPFHAIFALVLGFVFPAAASGQLITTNLGITVGPDTNPTAQNTNSLAVSLIFDPDTGTLSQTNQPSLGTLQFIPADQVTGGGVEATIRSLNTTNYGFTTSFLSAGTVVGPDLDWTISSWYGDSTWSNLAQAYIGIRVLVDGSFYYGYITFSTGSNVTESGGSLGPSTLTLSTATFETTPDTALTISAVPEPSACAAAAGIAALGIAVMRRRR